LPVARFSVLPTVVDYFVTAKRFRAIRSTRIGCRCVSRAVITLFVVVNGPVTAAIQNTVIPALVIVNLIAIITLFIQRIIAELNAVTACGYTVNVALDNAIGSGRITFHIIA